MKTNSQYAQEHFEELLNLAARGDAVEITRSDQSTFRLTLTHSSPVQQTSNRILGAGVGEMIVPTWEEWKAMDEEIVRGMNDKPFPS